MKQNVAIYTRTSKTKATNQVNYLENYSNKFYWNVYKIYEDTGCNGVDFDRPAFQELLKDIRENKINIVLVTNLSRIGRDYVETGYYIDNFFPENNIRLIALNDNFDSKKK